MDFLWWIIPLAALSLGGALWFEKNDRQWLVVCFKALTSALFILAALLAPRTTPTYFGWLVSGLSLCLVGDICLALKSKPAAFRAGLVAFLLGHLAYIIAFARFTKPDWWLSPVVLIAGAIAWLVWFWLRPYLGNMKKAVAAYIAIISLMAVAAVILQKNPMIGDLGSRLILIGALMFYGSDLLVARHRFVAPQLVNRLIGLPLYYAAQFCLAASIGLMI